MTWEIARAAVVTLLWPAAAAVSLAVAVRGDAVSVPGLVLLALGTTGAYAFDRLRDGGNSPAIRKTLQYAIAACAIWSLALIDRDHRLVSVVAFLGLLALLYVPLKRRVPKNAIATTAWTVAVVLLPAPVDVPWDGRHLLAAAAVACIMFANTTLCDLASIDADRGRGVKSVSVCYGQRVARWVSLVVAVAGMLCSTNAGLLATAAGQGIVAAFLPRPVRRWADAALLAAGPIALL